MVSEKNQLISVYVKRGRRGTKNPEILRTSYVHNGRPFKISSANPRPLKIGKLLQATRQGGPEKAIKFAVKYILDFTTEI